MDTLHCMNKYEELRDIQERVLDESDFYRITDETTGATARGIGNNGCLKIAAELGLTDATREEKCVEHDKYVRYEFTVEILDKEGRRIADDVGSCDTAEKLDWSMHNIRALARTRAWQRGIRRAAKVLDRLATDTGPTERVAPATASAPPTPAPQPSGPTCECELEAMKEPVRKGNEYMCDTCGRPVPKVKRIQLLSIAQ